MSKVAREFVSKLEGNPLQTYIQRKKNLFEVLNVQKFNGVGSVVQQVRWDEKGFAGCYWKVKKVHFKNIDGQPIHGKAWGFKFWRGKQLSDIPERIPGTLKYDWHLYKGPQTPEKETPIETTTTTTA
ncbi:hypothetical protein H4219_003919 [Mycoemilia scoparia]|uniref:Uncharacterized protein n=1 Tax=Mycoemilia scoparia TaxID=417184 RepID=A0A9W8DSP4_9FUNG|nr:hypothetical protein H4219_003919 [Mycoemilia scoparia]